MIDWTEHIYEDKFVDLRQMPRYTLKWTGTGPIENIYDVDVQLPDMPPLEEMVNYGLTEYDQIFRKVYIPKQVRFPNKNFGRENWTEQKIDQFIDLMWHIRRNGYWCIIKGIPRYIPGLLFFKMNFCDVKNHFIYMNSDRKFFTFWIYSLRCACDGVIDFKCRQLGDTENAITIFYEYASRVRHRNLIMQAGPKEDRAEEAFSRLTAVHRRMIYFFKPVAVNEDPKGSDFEFNYPQEYVTAKKIKEKDKTGQMLTTNAEDMYDNPPMNTKIMLGPSVHGHFDGTTDIGRAYLDEFSKAKKGFSVWEWLNVVKEAMFNKIRGEKTGHIVMTSTVEDIIAENMEEAFKLWNSSDPNSSEKMDNGKTVSGLWRVFRGAVDRGEDGNELDRWGDIDEKVITDKITRKYEQIFKVAGAKAAYSYLRKNPRTIEDVFKSVANLTQFNSDRLTARKIALMNMKPKPWVRGNLKWRDGIPDTEVVWEPNEDGRWVISQHPDKWGLSANAKVPFVTAPSPGNKRYFSMGIDPIDQNTTNATEGEVSKMGATVFKNFDASIDSEEYLYHQENHPDGLWMMGDPVDFGMHHSTNKFCCIYLHRDDNINNNFEDMILTMVYYGTDFLGEKQKLGSLRTYIEQRGYINYVPDKVTTTKNWRGQEESEGISANEKTFQEAFSYLDSYISKWGYAIDILDLVDELSTMNYKNKGKKDLGVGAGWTLYHATHKRLLNGDTLSNDNQHVQEQDFWEPQYLN